MTKASNSNPGGTPGKCPGTPIIHSICITSRICVINMWSLSIAMQMINKIIWVFKPKVPGDDRQCLDRLACCISDIRAWMKLNLLKLNDDKTEFLLLRTKHNISLAGEFEIKMGNDTITNSMSAKNMGVHFDANLKGTIHTNKLSSSVFLTICNIAKIRSMLYMDSTKILVPSTNHIKARLLQ